MNATTTSESRGDELSLLVACACRARLHAVATYSKFQVGAALETEDGILIGAITDGDIRRRLEKSHNPLAEMAKDLMSKNPKTVEAEELAEKALFMMEQFRIQNLFVIKKEAGGSTKVLGILHLQDLLQERQCN